jgi:hypothetical protein
MADLTPDKRKDMPAKDFGQPAKKGFPMNDKEHDRLAIGGATRSEHAGNISHSEADRIKAEARDKLGDDKKGGDPRGGDHKSAVSKMHPEHVHKLVQDAHAGKFGPEAQKTAQQAMQSPQGGAPQDQQPSGGSDYADMFSGGGSSAPEDDGPVPASQMFAGSRGGM